MVDNEKRKKSVKSVKMGLVKMVGNEKRNTSVEKYAKF